MSMTPEELSRLRELCEKASPHKWQFWPLGGNYGKRLRIGPYGEGGYEVMVKHDDAQFIAAARTALPQLLNEVERLRAENAELKRHLRLVPFEGEDVLPE